MEEYKDYQLLDFRQHPKEVYQKEICANIQQLARLNCMMPRGFRFELKSNIKDLNSEISSERKSRINYQLLAEGPPSEDNKQNSVSGISLNNDSKRHSQRKKKPAPFKDYGFVTQTQKKRKHHEGSIDKLKIEAKILKMLKEHPFGHHFLLPVQLEGYRDVIKEPMDFETVEKKIKKAEYTSFTQFKADIRKIWDNAHQFNEPGSQIYKETTLIKNYFEKLLSQVYSNPNEFLDPGNDLAGNEIPIQQNPIPDSGYQSRIHQHEEPSMTPEQKTELKNNLARLKSEKLQGVITLLRDCVGKQHNSEIFEFDIDKLPPFKCWELDKFVSQNLISTPIPKKGTPIEKENKKLSEGKIEGINVAGLDQMMMPPLSQMHPPMPNLFSQEESRQLNTERFLMEESDEIHIVDEESVRRPENYSRRIWDGSDIGHVDPSLQERDYPQSPIVLFNIFAINQQV